MQKAPIGSEKYGSNCNSRVQVGLSDGGSTTAELRSQKWQYQTIHLDGENPNPQKSPSGKYTLIGKFYGPMPKMEVICKKFITQVELSGSIRIKFITHLLADVGQVIRIDVAFLQKARGSVAKVKVQIDITLPRIQSVWIGFDSNNDINEEGHWKDIDIKFMPPTCELKKRDKERKKYKEKEEAGKKAKCPLDSPLELTGSQSPKEHSLQNIEKQVPKNPKKQALQNPNEQVPLNPNEQVRKPPKQHHNADKVFLPTWLQPKLLAPPIRVSPRILLPVSPKRKAKPNAHKRKAAQNKKSELHDQQITSFYAKDSPKNVGHGETKPPDTIIEVCYLNTSDNILEDDYRQVVSEDENDDISEEENDSPKLTNDAHSC
ncbi:hypothetical protein H5410_027617 [Solanum commersonii]|uniref:Uncharacterized protein n=1 Tax=Solanum commersonii TaxID=4109 RepID=A0A9J5Z1R6_SOLCO|nr:hypothetical protein H5410_027617 [Solanum commersonii]